VSAVPRQAADGVGRYRLGIDIGGTFTDFSLLDEVTGELASFKSPTVPGDPGRGVLDGLRALVSEQGLDLQAIDYLETPSGRRARELWETAAKRLRARVFEGMESHEQADRIVVLVERLCRERRWVVRYKEFRHLIGTWRFLHRWLAVVLMATVFFHILLSLRFGDLWIMFWRR